MPNLKEWWRNNVTGDGSDADFGKNFSRSTPESAGRDIDLDLPEMPDFPEAPASDQSVGDYTVGEVKSELQGFFQGVIIQVLKHLIQSGTEEKK